jgi:hypothetical protein
MCRWREYSKAMDGGRCQPPSISGCSKNSMHVSKDGRWKGIYILGIIILEIIWVRGAMHKGP